MEKIPAHVLKTLFEAGLNDTEIVERAVELGFERVKRQAITSRRSKMGYPRPRRTRRKVSASIPMPWEVRKEHQTRTAAQAISAQQHLDRGDEISAEQREALLRVKRHLRKVNGVLTYEPDTYEGWFIVPRREGIDGDLYRDPTVE